LAIIALITAAVGGAFAYLQSIEQRKSATAMASVQGWGTEAYAAGKGDWIGFMTPGNTPNTASSNLPLLIGAGAGLLLLTQK